jgi:hypothetical protein
MGSGHSLLVQCIPERVLNLIEDFSEDLAIGVCENVMTKLRNCSRHKSSVMCVVWWRLSGKTLSPMRQVQRCSFVRSEFGDRSFAFVNVRHGHVLQPRFCGVFGKTHGGGDVVSDFAQHLSGQDHSPGQCAVSWSWGDTVVRTHNTIQRCVRVPEMRILDRILFMDSASIFGSRAVLNIVRPEGLIQSTTELHLHTANKTIRAAVPVEMHVIAGSIVRCSNRYDNPSASTPATTSTTSSPPITLGIIVTAALEICVVAPNRIQPLYDLAKRLACRSQNRSPTVTSQTPITPKYWVSEMFQEQPGVYVHVLHIHSESIIFCQLLRFQVVVLVDFKIGVKLKKVWKSHSAVNVSSIQLKPHLRKPGKIDITPAHVSTIALQVHDTLMFVDRKTLVPFRPGLKLPDQHSGVETSYAPFCSAAVRPIYKFVPSSAVAIVVEGIRKSKEQRLKRIHSEKCQV